MKSRIQHTQTHVEIDNGGKKTHAMYGSISIKILTYTHVFALKCVGTQCFSRNKKREGVFTLTPCAFVFFTLTPHHVEAFAPVGKPRKQCFTLRARATHCCGRCDKCSNLVCLPLIKRYSEHLLGVMPDTKN